MAKTEEIIYSIKDQCSGKIPSDDTRLMDEFILYKINSVRALLIRESMMSSGIVDESYYQMKCCLEFKCDDIVCGGISSKSIVYYVELPKLIEGVGWKNILYFGNAEFPKRKIGLTNNFDRYSFPGFLSMENQEFIGNRPAYTVIGGYKDGNTTVDGNLAFVKNRPTSGLKYLCVLGLFASPQESVCEEEDFNSMEYPLPAHMVHRLELIVIQQILSTEVVPGDPVQDSMDNTGNKSEAMDPRAMKGLANQEDYRTNE